MKMQFGLSLAALDSTDVGTCRKWRNDYRIWSWCRQSDFISDVEQAGWFERQAKDTSIKMYKIMCNVDTAETMVGVCGLTSIDWVNRKAEFSLYVDPDKHARGYGKEALGLLLVHGFTNLNLNLIWGETFQGNPAFKMFLGLGFQPEGTRRSFYFKDGKYIDAHLISLTADDWREYGKPRDSSKPVSDDNQFSGGSDCSDGPVLDIKPLRRKAATAAKPRLKSVEKERQTQADLDL